MKREHTPKNKFDKANVEEFNGVTVAVAGGKATVVLQSRLLTREQGCAACSN